MKSVLIDNFHGTSGIGVQNPEKDISDKRKSPTKKSKQMCKLSK